MIRKKPLQVSYREQTGFFRPDYGDSQEYDKGCILEEDLQGDDP